VGNAEFHAPWIDRSHHLLSSCKFTASAQHGSIHIVLTEMANLLYCLCLSFCSPVPFATHHELPGDAGDFIGERHSYQLWFLTLQEFDQPLGSMSASTCSDILKKGSCANHQYAPQHFVASSGVE
jgi:hypothetical protein